MKKIAITIAAVAAFGLAACNDRAADTNNATDVNATETEAGNDLDVAANDANAVSATDNALDSVGNAVEGAAEGAANAATDAANTVSNAVD